MAGAPYATPSDVAAIWRPLTPEEEAVVGAWIEMASQQIRDEVPLVAGLTVDQRIEADLLARDTVRNVVRQMVLRITKNPDSVVSHSESFGTFSQSDTFSRAVAGGEMFISESELARLTARTRSRRQVAFMIGSGPTIQPTGRSYPFERPLGL